MRAIVNGMRLPQNWQDYGAVHSGAKPLSKVASLPTTDWNGNSFCDPGCVLYYPGYPGTGATIHDFSGKGNHGTIVDATWARLPSGLWYQDFDGATALINAGNGASLQITGNLILEAWVKSPRGNNNRGIMVKDGGGGDRGWYLGTVDVGNVGTRMLVSPDGIAVSYFTTTNTFPANDVWTHVVGDYNGTSMDIYFNTVKQAGTQTNAVPAAINDSSEDCEVGGITTDPLLGGIALPRIYTAGTVATVLYHRQQERYLFGV